MSVSLLARALAAPIFLALFFFASAVSADVISPDQEACSGAAEGAACKIDGKSGACAPREHCRPDFSNTDDAGEPAQICSSRMTCFAGESPSEKPARAEGCASAGSGFAPVASFVVGCLILVGIRRRREE